MKSEICVVVADRSRARFLSATDTRGPLVEETSFVNPGSRHLEHERRSDRSGRAGNRATGRSWTCGSEGRIKADDARTFARCLAAELRDRRLQGRLDRLYLIAQPSLLGLLRRELDPPTADRVTDALDKSLTQRSAAEIRAALPACL